LKKALALVLMLSSFAAAESAATRPSILNEVTVTQRLGEQLPLQLPFRDETGKTIKLGDTLRGKPVLLVPVYYECPSLCNVTLNQLTRTLNAMTENVGEDFDIVTVSFSPTETPTLAAAKKANYLRSYGRPSAGAGWYFLTGEDASIVELMKTIGFDYQWDEKYKIYAHAAAVIVVSPQGKISQYFLGVDYPPTLVSASFKQATAEQVGKVAPSVFLYCFKYDPNTGKYGLIINRSLQVFGVLTVFCIVGLLFTLNHVRHRQERASEQQASGPGGAA
jgi:protein SCO1/2